MIADCGFSHRNVVIISLSLSIGIGFDYSKRERNMGYLPGSGKIGVCKQRSSCSIRSSGYLKLYPSKEHGCTEN